MKKLYFLDEQEKNRILNLHTEATKKQYLVNKDILNEASPLPKVFSTIKKYFHRSGFDSELGKWGMKYNRYFLNALDNALKNVPSDYISKSGQDFWLLDKADDSPFTLKDLENLLDAYTTGKKSANDPDLVGDAFEKFADKPLDKKNFDLLMGQIPEKIRPTDLNNKAVFNLRDQIKDQYSLLVNRPTSWGDIFTGVKNLGNFLVKPLVPKESDNIGSYVLRQAKVAGGVGGGIVIIGGVVQYFAPADTVQENAINFQKNLSNVCFSEEVKKYSTTVGDISKAEVDRLAAELPDIAKRKSVGYYDYITNPEKRKGYIDVTQYKEILNTLNNAFNFCQVYKKFNADNPNQPGPNSLKPFTRLFSQPYRASWYGYDLPDLFYDEVISPTNSVLGRKVKTDVISNQVERDTISRIQNEINELKSKYPKWTNPRCSCAINNMVKNPSQFTKTYSESDTIAIEFKPTTDRKIFYCANDVGNDTVNQYFNSSWVSSKNNYENNDTSGKNWTCKGENISYT